MNLVIIEGAGKKDTIKKYLGSNYEVIATKGHIRDLPVKKLGVNLLKNFEPEYEIMPDKKDIVTMLKQKASKADNILLATDPDREGEAISWHLAHILNLNPDNKIRIVFNEISKNAVTNALNNPRSIDQKLVDAQQARRVLDRLVGYKVSPILCKKIKPNLSAGRVQSVALKLLVDRENEIRNFKPEEYWTIVANLFKENIKDAFKANLVKHNNKTFKVTNQNQKDEVLNAINNGKFVVSSIKKTVGKTKPQPPYTTSTMQQDASTKLGFTLKKTTTCAQELYEGVNIEGEGKVALVTYIRTDSVRVSPEATQMAKEYILANFGAEYYPKTPNVYKSKTLAQDAHEAIRPITLSRTPEMVKPYISSDNYKLYKLIYERFLASQMAESTYNQVTVEIENNGYTFKATGKTPLFDGFLKATTIEKSTKKQKAESESEEELNEKIPPLNEQDELNLIEIVPTQKFTKAPTRYTEATLVKEMEEKGIGRPATYAPTITTLDSRKYTVKEGKFLVPTELGEKVVELLGKYFSNIINVEFTAKMEDELDIITQKDMQWQKVIENFYGDFEKMLRNANLDGAKFKITPKETEEICEKCGSPMILRTGKFGEFLACSNYPNCKNIRKTNSKLITDVKCPKCNGEIMLKTSKRGTEFYGCANYPTCDFVSWDKPLNENCPLCNSYLTVKNLKTINRIKCSNPNCKYTRDEKI